MKKVNRYAPDVPQRMADSGTEIVERHLAMYGVSRAMDLPEEGKVRLMRDLQGFYRQEMPEGITMLNPSDLGWRGFLKRCWTSVFHRRRTGPRS